MVYYLQHVPCSGALSYSGRAVCERVSHYISPRVTAIPSAASGLIEESELRRRMNMGMML